MLTCIALKRKYNGGDRHDSYTPTLYVVHRTSSGDLVWQAVTFLDLIRESSGADTRTRRIRYQRVDKAIETANMLEESLGIPHLMTGVGHNQPVSAYEMGRCIGMMKAAARSMDKKLIEAVESRLRGTDANLNGGWRRHTVSAIAAAGAVGVLRTRHRAELEMD